MADEAPRRVLDPGVDDHGADPTRRASRRGPGASGTAIVPSSGASGPASRPSNWSSVASPHGSSTRSAAAQCTAAAMPERPVERRREVDVGAGRAHERRLREQRRDAARARDLQADGVGGAAGERAGIGGRLVHRDPHRDALAHRRAAPRSRGPAPRRARAPAGASASIASTAVSTSQAPLASRRSATCGPDGGAHRGDAARVVAAADLELDAVEARAAAASRAAAAAVARSSAPIVALTGTRVSASSASSATSGRLLADPGQRPQREVDRGERLGERVGGAAGVEQRGAAADRAGAQRRRLRLERRAAAGQRDAVVGLERRGLAPADAALVVLDAQDQQRALGDLAVRGAQRLAQAQRDRLDRRRARRSGEQQADGEQHAEEELELPGAGERAR